MYLYWTVLIALTMHVTPSTAAVATLPVSTSSEMTNVGEHVPSADSRRKFLTEFAPDDIQLGCRELRAKRFISDGFCTSIKPIKEVVCAGVCLPIKEQNLPWWTEFTKYWARPKYKEWRCVENKVKLKKVQLMCQDGTVRHYKIKIVKSCRCKSYEREPNKTDPKDPPNERGKEHRDVNKIQRRKSRRDKRRLRKQRERELRRQNRRKNKANREKLEKHEVREKNSKRHGEPKKHSSDTVSDSRTRHPVGTNASPEL